MKSAVYLFLILLTANFNYAQVIRGCEMIRQIKTPLDILNSPTYINADPYFFIEHPDQLDLLSKSIVSFNHEYIQTIKSEGFYWRSKVLRQPNKNDVKKLPNLEYVILTENDSLFIYEGQVYKNFKEPTKYKNWFMVKYSDYQEMKDIAFAGISQNSFHKPKMTLSEKVKTVDLDKFKDTEMKIIEIKPTNISFSVGDSIVIGVLLDRRQSTQQKTPMLINKTVERAKKDLVSDQRLFNLKVLPGDYVIKEFSLTSLPYFITSVELQNDIIHFNLSFHSYDGVKDNSKDIKKKLSDNNLRLYEYACLNVFFAEIKAKRQKASKEYDEHLKANYTEKEITSIKTNKAFIGMSEKALYESLGEPLETNTTIIKGLTQKQCVYGPGIYIYVENGKVTGWQNFESLRF